jgi:hypothetical protein
MDWTLSLIRGQSTSGSNTRFSMLQMTTTPSMLSRSFLLTTRFSMFQMRYTGPLFWSRNARMAWVVRSPMDVPLRVASAENCR